MSDPTDWFDHWLQHRPILGEGRHSLGFAKVLQLATTDAYYMDRAIELSEQGIGHASPNPAVGCVLVRHRQIIAEGFTRAYGGWHAERSALEGHVDVRGATAYVTLEPCSHHGKQPPCIDALFAAGVSRCVIGLVDPNPLVSGQGIKKLRDSGMAIELGIHEEHIKAMLAPFRHWITKSEPFVAIKMALSANGLMANDEHHSKWITGPEARIHAHRLRQYYDAIVVGSGTVLADFPTLTMRDWKAKEPRHPLRIVVDPRGQIARCSEEELCRLGETTFNHEVATIYVGPEISKIARRFPHIYCRSEGRLQTFIRSEEWKKWTETIHGKPIQSYLIEGGASLIRSMEGHWHKAHLFRSPRLIEAPLRIHSISGDMFKSSKLLTYLTFEKDQYLELLSPLSDF